MDFRDYDRKFWLVVENGNKKIDEFHLNFKGNSFLCYSYYSPTHICNGVGPGLVYEALNSAIYVDGEYQLTKEPLYDKTTRYFTQDKLNGFLVISIENKAVNIMFENFTRMINSIYYKDKNLETSNIQETKNALKLTKDIANLIYNIESLIGNKCYNAKSGYGYGDYIRYPVWAYTTQDKEKVWEKFRYNTQHGTYPNIKPSEAKSLEYRFGANELEIGKAIIEVLEFLEKRYNLDFEELEKNLKKKD